MRNAALNWRYTQRFNPRRGAVIGSALYGRNSRFLIEECYRDNADYYYRLRDAERVSDAAIRDGKRSPVVVSSDDLAKIVRVCRLVEAREYLASRARRRGEWKAPDLGRYGEPYFWV